MTMPEQCAKHQTFSRCTDCDVEFHVPTGYALVTESDVELLNAAAAWTARLFNGGPTNQESPPKPESTREHWEYQKRGIVQGVDCYVFRFDIPADHPDAQKWTHKMFAAPVATFWPRHA